MFMLIFEPCLDNYCRVVSILNSDCVISVIVNIHSS